MSAAATLARRIAELIELHCIPTSTELAAHRRIRKLLEAEGFEVECEVALTRGDRIDVLVGTVGVEVKVRGGRRLDILRQLERYAASDRVEALVLGTGGAWPRGFVEVKGKPLFVASLVGGWL